MSLQTTTYDNDETFHVRGTNGLPDYKIPILKTVRDALYRMDALVAELDVTEMRRHETMPFIFHDRGWCDNGETPEISICVDSSGQRPEAMITSEVYKQLIAEDLIGPNTLQTCKARRVHDYTEGVTV